jgi:hypothetical protein
MISMFHYPVTCIQPGCGRPAEYKIAARWSDGQTHELKTYGLVCGTCLPAQFAAALAKQAACCLAPGECLERPGIFRLAAGLRDQKLERLTDLETRLTALA